MWKLCRCGESKEEERCNYTMHQHQEIMECLKEKTSNCCADEVQKLCGLQAEINFHNLPKQIDTDGNNCSCLELKFEKDLFSFKFWYKLGYDYRTCFLGLKRIPKQKKLEPKFEELPLLYPDKRKLAIPNLPYLMQLMQFVPLLHKAFYQSIAKYNAKAEKEESKELKL